MQIKKLRTFLPSKDFEISKAFYREMGFSVQWENEELCIFGSTEYNFFLQKYYQKDWAENLMMQLFVDDLDSLFTICDALIKKYEGLGVQLLYRVFKASST